MINRVVLVGRLTKDPELKFTPAGVAVANFTLAVNRQFSKDGNREADFINCVIWRKPAENVANFLRKGSLAGVEGRIQTRNYENSEGRRVYVTEIVADSVQFLEPRNSGGQQSGGSSFGEENNFNQNRKPNDNNNNNNNNRYEDDPFAGGSQPIDISDDDLPF